MFGSHLSIAGSMVNALHDAERLALDTVQVFTKNQQQWKAKPLDDAMVREWRAEIERLGWSGRTVSHASYLINLAAHADELFAKSVDLMTNELERCEALGIPFLVHHPGSFVGWPGNDGLQRGIARIADAYREIFRRTAGFKVVACLEGTVGAGSQIGGKLEHLRDLRQAIIDVTGEPRRVAFCLDTCHLHAAGYDLSTTASADSAFDLFDQVCGLAHLRVMHLNDSKGKLASKLDRHEHIGQGWVGGGASLHSGAGQFDADRLRGSGFASVVRRTELRDIPKILETPKGMSPDGRDWDSVNLERLRALQGMETPAPPPTRASAGGSPRVTKARKPAPKPAAARRKPSPRTRGKRA